MFDWPTALRFEQITYYYDPTSYFVPGSVTSIQHVVDGTFEGKFGLQQVFLSRVPDCIETKTIKMFLARKKPRLTYK